MKLGYGLITAQRYPGDSRDATTLYREAIELARLAEQSNLDSVWTSEHHFWDDDYMPSLLVVSAAIAAVTQRIEIGTGVLLAPLYHPIRLAEDAATVDLISGGRLILGLGIGWRQEEFERLGIPMDKLGRRMTEMVKILRAAWGPGTFTHSGQTYQIEETNVTPKPARKIPIWIGGFVDAALRRAGRIGDAYFGSSVAFDDFKRRVDVVNEGLQKAGRDASDFTFAVHEPVWVCDDPDRGFEEILPYLHYSRWKYRDMGAEFARYSEPLPVPPKPDERTVQGYRDALVIGAPADVAARIDMFRQIAGPDLHFVARSYYPGVPFELAVESIDRLGQVRQLL